MASVIRTESNKYFGKQGEFAPEYTKYNSDDNLTKLEADDDAATSNWGTSWRTPTKDEFKELIEKCTWTWKGNGYEVKGANGKCIFFPVTGTYSGDIPFFRKCGNLQSLAISLNQNGTALMALGQKRQAVDNFREAAELCNKMSNPLNELQARKGLYEALWDINPDSAKIELEKYNDIKNKLYYSGATESLARYTAEYGNEQLSDENQKVKHNNILLGVGILVSVLLLGVIVFFYMRVRKRSRLQQLRLFAHYLEHAP